MITNVNYFLKANKNQLDKKPSESTIDVKAEEIN